MNLDYEQKSKEEIEAQWGTDLDEPDASEIVVVLDPGKLRAGLTVWIDGELVSAYLPRGEGPVEVAKDARDYLSALGIEEANVLVCEWPQVYPGIRREDPNDLLPLAGCVCAFAALLPHKERVQIYPRVWTKGTPKDIRIARLEAAATSDEKALIAESQSPKAFLHNVWDAYGLGKWYFNTRVN